LIDKWTPPILEALSRAAAEPDGLPLHSGKSAPGLFTATPAGKHAAQRCKDEGYLRTLRTETRGKTIAEICAITEKGLAYLLSQASPKQVVADFIRPLDARQGQIASLVDTACRMQTSLESLKALAEKVLTQAATPVGPTPSTNGTDHGPRNIFAHLLRWHESGASGDCPLPDLYRLAAPHLTIGQFHDSLRKLHEQERVYLHPWSGPLYDLPEHSLALLVGHEIAYYASIRLESRSV
jgi:hypothetical protein